MVLANKYMLVKLHWISFSIHSYNYERVAFCLISSQVKHANYENLLQIILYAVPLSSTAINMFTVKYPVVSPFSFEKSISFMHKDTVYTAQ